MEELSGFEHIWQKVELNIHGGTSTFNFYRLTPGVLPFVQAFLDAWPSGKLAETAFIRYAVQDNCVLNCAACVASEHSAAANLSADEIVSQIKAALTLVSNASVVIANFGLGESLANPNFPAALERILKLRAEAKDFKTSFIVSTHGPKNGAAVFAQLCKIVERRSDTSLQISLDFTTDAARQRYVGAKVASIATLSSWATQWNRITGTKVLLNCCVGPDFTVWDDEDYGRFFEAFPPDITIAKLSPEGPRHLGSLVEHDYNGQISTRQSRLRDMGYDVVIYDPEGTCGGIFN